MGANWAAREGDALLHTSPWADLVGGVLEVAANMVIQMAAQALVALAIGVEAGSLGCGTVLAIGLVVGAVMIVTGLGDKLTEWCQDIGNALFPPTIQAHVDSGSADTRINGKRAARAAGICTATWTVTSRWRESMHRAGHRSRARCTTIRT